MYGYVANTDQQWFTFLRSRKDIDEVNFWQPSGGRSFRAVGPGSPFFFKLKAPYRAIGGFGIFIGHSTMPAWLAWDAFGAGNGAPDFATMRKRIEQYRRAKPDPYAQYEIGCIIVGHCTFFDDSDWVKEPSNWANPIVQGKTYDLRHGEGRRIYEACIERVQRLDAPDMAMPGAAAEQSARYGSPQLVLPRLGQGAFKISVTDAYGRACAVTTEHSLPVLDAAHIRPYADGGEHSVSNGLLLRTDIHRLFDKGYVTVTTEQRFEVSSRLKEDWENGRAYYALHGSQIHVPGRQEFHPSVEALQWHNSEVFLG